MGYWHPPSINAYEPVARPLGGTAATSAAEVQALTQPEVLAALGVNTLLDQPALDWLKIGGRIWVPDVLDVPLLLAMASSPLVKGRGFLLAYSLLYETRPPPSSDDGKPYITNERLKGPFSPEVKFPRYFFGHLSTGGLPPDMSTLPAGPSGPAGAIVLSYWDLSDSNWPRAKCVTHWPMNALVGSGDEDQATGKRPYKGDGGRTWRVMEWNFDQQRWQEEGGDAEREFINSEAEIFSTVLLVTKMVVSCVPVLGAYYEQMIQLTQDAWSLMLAHMRPDSGRITFDEVFSKLGGDTIGLVGAFGGATVGLQPDGHGGTKPLTVGDVLSNAARDQFNGAMATAQGFPIVGVATNLGVDVVSQGTKYVSGLVEIGKKYGIGNIKVSVDDIKKYVAAQFAGQAPTPVKVLTTFTAPTPIDTPAGSGTAPTIPSPAEMAPNTYQRQAWEAACIAYAALPNPVDVLRMRRNAVLGYRNSGGGNSATIVTPGDEGGIGAHGVEVTDESAMDVGTAFDQYLSQMHANEFAGSILARAQYASSESFARAVPYQGDPRALLNDIVAKLKKRYGLV